MSNWRWTGMAALLLLVGLTSASSSPLKKGDEVETVRELPTDARNPHYISNRNPLLPNPLIKLPIGSIEPHGWIRHQLQLMADGMVGRLPELSQWCRTETNSWMEVDGKGFFGWEELPYWLKGYGDLGYVLKDEGISKSAKTWIDGVLSSQGEDGFFGPRANLKGTWGSKDPDLWPNMVMLNVLQTFHEATGDERVVPFLTKYFKWQHNLPKEKLVPSSWQKLRAGDNLESIHWTYNRTGEEWLLDLAAKIHENTARWDEGPVAFSKDGWVHGVNQCQGFREPGQWYSQSGDKKDLEASERTYHVIMNQFGQVPGGMFGADENCRPGNDDPRQGAETCSMVEFMHSTEMLMKLTGLIRYADRCEDVAFNSFPAAVAPDWKGLHYLTSPNQIQLDRENKSPAIQNPGTMFPYSPHRYRCCQHNVSHGWPYYAEHLWCATQDSGLALTLFAPSKVNAKVADGVEISMEETTDYPFRDTVNLKLTTAKKVTFPLYIRVPKWCDGMKVKVNGVLLKGEPKPQNWARISRVWETGDTVQITMPMPLRTKVWERNHNAVSVHRGPLAFSLKIGEEWKSSGDAEWPMWEVFPTTPWNYGLTLDPKNPEASFTVSEKEGAIADQPFTPDNAPLMIWAKGRRISEWKKDRMGMIGELQDSPVKTDEKEEDITLIPMGCARLRISSFPQIGAGENANQWKEFPWHSMSQYDFWSDPKALHDGIEPSSSHDRQNPRFTWWDHVGTLEWVTTEFDQPKEVSSCAVYWYRDATEKGKIDLPESWTLYYRKDGTWKPVRGVEQYPITADAYDSVKFEAVKTDALKLEAQLKNGLSAGLLEWRIK